jgi:hypothetical protein
MKRRIRRSLRIRTSKTELKVKKSQSRVCDLKELPATADNSG